MGAIDSLNEIDRENYSRVRKALRYASELPEDVLNVYNAFYLAINPLLKDRKDQRRIPHYLACVAPI